MKSKRMSPPPCSLAHTHTQRTYPRAITSCSVETVTEIDKVETRNDTELNLTTTKEMAQMAKIATGTWLRTI